MIFKALQYDNRTGYYYTGAIWTYSLAQNKELTDILENVNNLPELLNKSDYFDNSGWRILKRNSSVYQPIESRMIVLQ